MEEIKIKGIVIKSVDYKDSDKIVTIFSAERGLIKARARGVKKAKAKLAFAVQPFAFVEFLMSERGGFYTIINATSIDQFFALTEDFDNYIFMLSCLEIIEKTVKENDAQVELFVLLASALKAVAYQGVSSMTIFIKFILESMKYLGFSLKLENCACCENKLLAGNYGFSYDYNGFLCEKCKGKFDYLDMSAGEFAILKNINNANFDMLDGLKFSSRENIVSVISFLVKVFRIITDEEITTIKQFI